MKQKLAIIGASTGQLPLCLKAHQLGIETHCFAWEQGAICKNHVDEFHPISIFDQDAIVEKCRKIGINGVVSNASEACALVASYVSNELRLPGVPYSMMLMLRDKAAVRKLTNQIKQIQPVAMYTGSWQQLLSSVPRPFVLKPVTGSAKKGVILVNQDTQVVSMPADLNNVPFVAEEYVCGREYSIETISCHGVHTVVQITDKVSTGAPHFVELAHHQPADITDLLRKKIATCASAILNAVGFDNSAAHIEIKIDDHNAISLIEINPRGGGDFISNELVSLSTDCDYLAAMIQVSLGCYEPREYHATAYAGIYYLCSQTARLLPHFKEPPQSWLVSRELQHDFLSQSISNYDRDGYLIYKANKKIRL